MTALPGALVTRTNGSLSIPAPAPSKSLVIGPCSLGTANTKYTFGQPSSINTTLGYGPAVTAAQIILADGGGSIDVIKANASIAATSGSFVSSSVNSVPMGVSGTPLDTYAVRGSITKAGALDAAAFQFSLDGGSNYSPSLTVHGTYVVPNTGMTLIFGTGSYSVGDTFSFQTYAPQMNATDLTNAINSFTGSNSPPIQILVANDSQVAASGSALFTALDSALTSLDQTYFLPTMGILPAGGVNAGTTATVAAFAANAASTGNVIGVVAERANIQVPIPFMGYGNPQLPFAYAVADRINSSLMSTSPARVKSGALTRVTSPTYDEFVNGEVYLDANIMAPRTMKQYPGTFLQQSVLKSQPGSGYSFVQWGRVIVNVSIVVEQALAKYINSAVRVLKDGTGYIDPRDANIIDNDVNAQLKATIMLPINAEGFKGHATSVQFAVDRQTNVLTTSQIQSTCAVIPLANVSGITCNLGFTTAVTPVTQ